MNRYDAITPSEFEIFRASAMGRETCPQFIASLRLRREIVPLVSPETNRREIEKFRCILADVLATQVYYPEIDFSHTLWMIRESIRAFGEDPDKPSTDNVVYLPRVLHDFNLDNYLEQET